MSLDESKTIETIALQIGDLENKVQKLREERTNFHKKAAEYAKKRNMLNDQVRELISTAKEERTLREQYLNDAKTLKQEIDQLNETLEEKKQLLEQKQKELESLNEELKANPQLRNRTRQTNISPRQIEKEIARLEWKLQTIPNLNPEAEKEIVSMIEVLQQKKKEASQIYEIEQEIRKLQREIRFLSGKIKRKQEIYEDKEKKAHIHARNMKQAYMHADKIKKEADNYHQEFINAKKQADAAHQELMETVSRIKELRQELKKLKEYIRQSRIESKKQEQQRQRLQEKERLQKEAIEALQKFESGKKLTFEEFRALISAGKL